MAEANVTHVSEPESDVSREGPSLARKSEGGREYAAE